MKVSDFLILREFATTLYPRSRNDWTTPAPMPCEAPVTMTVFCLLAMSASLALVEMRDGGSVPVCSAAMYAAYESGQFGSRCPLRFWYSPWAASARRSALARCAVDANAVSDAAGVPRCDLLDQPRITVGIIEGEERPIAGVLGIGAGKPCLRGKRRAVPHLTRVDATADEFVMSRFDVGDNQRRRGRARRCRN